MSGKKLIHGIGPKAGKEVQIDDLVVHKQRGGARVIELIPPHLFIRVKWLPEQIGLESVLNVTEVGLRYE